MEDSEKTLEAAEPVEEVTEEITDVDETPQKESNSDTTSEDSSENNVADKQDSNEEAESEEQKEEQPKSERAEFAQVRRKAEEEANLKIESEKKKAYEQGRLDAYKGKVNPYTNKPITDLADIEMYEMMYKLESEGKDPINDLPEAMATKRRDEAKIIQEKKELESKTKQELDEFTKKYPDVNVSELLSDSFFMDYIQGKNKALTELYEGFNNLKNAFRNSAVKVAKQTIANSQATPGSLKSEVDVTVDYNTMSSEEFNRQLQMVKDGEIK